VDQSRRLGSPGCWYECERLSSNDRAKCGVVNTGQSYTNATAGEKV
jgi:hypothetical protein